QSVVFQAGTTQLPDLRDITVSTNSAGHKVVTFTFDQALPFPVGPNAPAADFHLYDAAAKQYTSGTSGTVNPDGKSVSFAGPNTPRRPPPRPTEHRLLPRQHRLRPAL